MSKPPTVGGSTTVYAKCFLEGKAEEIRKSVRIEIDSI